MARKKKHEEHENHERWLVSYADFITLLFAFFVVMYSLSSVNEGKYRVLSESLISAFNAPTRSIQPVTVGDPQKGPVIKPPQTPPSPQSSPSPAILPPIKPPISAAEQQRRAAEMRAKVEAERAKTMAAIAEQIEKALSPLIDKDLVHVRRARTWLEVEINTSILFPSGSAALSNSAIPTLKHVAEILGRYPNPIHVEGFTDNRPIKTVAFPSNWELSAARAASVVHLFSSVGVAAERMAAIGYGEHHAVGDNATAAGRNANRRVVLVILADPNAKRLRDQSPDPNPADSADTPVPPAVTSAAAAPPATGSGLP
jgi:chemotaxis protein MotB